MSIKYKENYGDLNNVFNYKLHRLVISERILILLELIGFIAIFLFIIKTNVNIDNNFHTENTKQGLIAFMISIIMALKNSSTIRKKKNLIKIYLTSLKIEKSDEMIRNYFNNAMQIIKPIDIHLGKQKSGEKIKLHDRREIIRWKMKNYGITFMIVIAVLIVFILKLNLPILLAWESLIAYAIVMAEFFYYQYIINKEGINVFTYKHKNLINSYRNKEEEMKFLQKILYMHCDRYRNYETTLLVATNAINIIAIIITIITSSNNDQLIRWFGFANIAIYIPLIFTILSIILYFIDKIFGNRWDDKINRLSGYLSLSYNNKNYRSIKKLGLDKYTNNFSRKALEVARGTYEYNIEKINEDNSSGIYFKYVFKVQHRIINNIPRIKLLSLTSLLFWGAILVWGSMNIFNFVYVLIITLSITIITYIIMRIYTTKKYSHWELDLNDKFINI